MLAKEESCKVNMTLTPNQYQATRHLNMMALKLTMLTEAAGTLPQA